MFDALLMAGLVMAELIMAGLVPAIHVFRKMRIGK
jgi:hypothetical protein